MSKIAILGLGKEGEAIQNYFSSHDLSGQKTKDTPEITVFDDFTPQDLVSFDLRVFDAVFRSPSVPPHFISGGHTNLNSATRFFFAHCPCPIIGVTGTKGKGTTCSMLAAILREYFKDSEHQVHLVGNIGTPAIEILDIAKPEDIVIYELSSFQLWDLEYSPHIAVVLRVEPDHLDKHSDFTDYVSAKTNIVRHQTKDDTCIYFKDNETSRAIAAHSKGQKIAYPNHEYNDLIANLKIPGEHNKENAAAAIAAFLASIRSYDEDRVSEARNDEPERTTRENAAIAAALSTFTPLPHHIEFVRSIDNVDYYDDSFSASYPSLDVALASFQDRPTVLIAGGKDRHLDLTATKRRIFDAKNLVKAILIGETAPQLADGEDSAKYEIASSLKEAVEKAKAAADAVNNSSKGPKQSAPEQRKKEFSSQNSPVVLLSPGAASFDMFKNFYDRGEKFQSAVNAIKELK